MAVDGTNSDAWRDSEIVIPRGTVHVFRSKILWDKTCHERLRIHNYGRGPVDVSFAIEFDADFADIFEVRGMNRERRGRRLQSQVRKDGLVLGYEGLDNRIRRTRIVFDPPPTRLNESVATFQIRLEAGKDASSGAQLRAKSMAIPQIRSHFSTKPLWRRRRVLCNVCVPESRRFLREM